MSQPAAKNETIESTLTDIVDSAFGPLDAHMRLWGTSVNSPGAGQDELNAWIVTRALVDQAREAIAGAVEYADSKFGPIRLEQATHKGGQYHGVSIAE